MQRTPPLPPPAASVADRFANIIAGACKAVGEAQNRGLPGPVAALIWSYLQRLNRRFAKLARMALDGTLKPPRDRRPQAKTLPADDPPDEAAAPRPKPKPQPRKLIRFSGWRWIARRAQYTGVFGGHLAVLLEDPEMIRLLGLDRRFTKMLRPLAIGLGTQLITPGRLGPAMPQERQPRPKTGCGPQRERAPRKPRAKKVRWKAAKPPHYGLEFSDPTLNLWYGR
jgi:hypothetical protein